MSELHQYYDNIRRTVEPYAAEAASGHVYAAAAAMILNGVGLTDQYTINDQRTRELVPVETEGETGLNPLVGLNLSGIADLQVTISKSARVSNCPEGWEGVKVGDWFIGGGNITGRNSPAVQLGSYRKDSKWGYAGQTILTTPMDIILATMRAIETGVVSDEQLARVTGRKLIEVA